LELANILIILENPFAHRYLIRMFTLHIYHCFYGATIALYILAVNTTLYQGLIGLGIFTEL